MEREEPRFGTSELSGADVVRSDYRTFPTPPRCEPRHLVWKIAAGVVLGNAITAVIGTMIALIMMGLAADAARQAITDLNKKNKGQVAAEQQRYVDSRPLAPNEHCANGKRFRLTNDGWVETGTGCPKP